MCLNDGSSDGQSQTGTAHAAITRLVRSLEAIEHMGKVCAVNPDPVIDDRESQCLVAFQLRTEHDLSSCSSGMNGVADDVAQRLAHAHPVKLQKRQAVGGLKQQLNMSSPDNAIGKMPWSA